MIQNRLEFPFEILYNKSCSDLIKNERKNVKNCRFRLELLRHEKAEASSREDTLTQEAAAKNRERIRAAEQEAEAVLRQADANAGQAIEALRAQAEQNGQSAVEAVLRRLA